MQTIRIRASYLAYYPDCPRRSVARLVENTVKRAGYSLVQTLTGIGAAVGTATHIAAAYQLREKIRTGEIGRLKDSQEIGVEAFKRETFDGVEYDGTTPNSNAAHRQITTLTRCYFHQIAPNSDATDIEIRLEAEIRPGYILSGSMDELSPWTISDTKTGVKLALYEPQIGAYSLLVKSAPGRPNPRSLRFAHLARVPISKPYPGAKIYLANQELAERMAAAYVNRLIDDIESLKKTGATHGILCNPNSIMCSRKFCTAFGTNFCPESTCKSRAVFGETPAIPHNSTERG